MGYWVTNHKTGELYYQVNKRVKLDWKSFTKESLKELLARKQITTLDYLEALLDIDL